MAQEGKTSEDAGGDDGGPFGVLHRVDRALYFGERFIVVTFLICIAVTMFVDVAYGRLVAQDSKVGKVLAKLAGIEDMETRTWIDQTIAPWLALGLGVALIWFGFWTAERHKGAPFLKVKQSALAMTAITSAVLAGTGWLMMQMESVQFYLLVYVGASALYVARLWRERPERWQTKIGAMLLVVTPLYAWLIVRWVPEGYTWSQELSLMMLLWIGFLGASVCAYEGKHLRMEAFDKIMSPEVKRWVHAGGFVGAAAFSAFMCYLGFEYVASPGAATHSSQMNIPDRASIVAVPIAFLITTVRFLAAAASSAMGGGYGRHKSEDQAIVEELDGGDAEEPA